MNFLRSVLMGAGLAAISTIAVGIVTDGANATFTALVVWSVAGIAGLLWEVAALATPSRPSPQRPTVTHSPQQEQPPIVIQYESAPTPPPAPAAFTPGPPQRPYVPEERPAQDIDTVYNSLFGEHNTYRAPNQPVFDPLAYAPGPMPDLERELAAQPAPWDEERVSKPLSPLQEGHLLPRRPATQGEYSAIRAIFEQQGSLNKTVNAVYGSKDASTLAWIKEALEQ